MENSWRISEQTSLHMQSEIKVFSIGNELHVSNVRMRLHVSILQLTTEKLGLLQIEGETEVLNGMERDCSVGVCEEHSDHNYETQLHQNSFGSTRVIQ